MRHRVVVDRFEDMTQDQWNRRIERSLAERPEIHASADFAARVMAALPLEEQSLSVRTGYGRRAVLLCASLLIALMLLLVTGVAHASSWIATLLVVELVSIAVTAGPWRRVLHLPV